MCRKFQEIYQIENSILLQSIDYRLFFDSLNNILFYNEYYNKKQCLLEIKKDYRNRFLMKNQIV